MTETDVLEINGDLRVRLVPDSDPEEPYDDGASPIVALSYDERYGWIAEQVGGTSYEVHPRILEAFRLWHDYEDMLMRYLRVFHGVTTLESFTSSVDRGSPTFYTFDPADWRERVGAPEGSVNADEHRAWLDGDVWGYVIEKCVVWTPDDDSYGSRVTWEQVDSVCGFYGRDCAETEAREAFPFWTL